MCWRDNLTPPSAEGIAWANQMAREKRVNVGDHFSLIQQFTWLRFFNTAHSGEIKTIPEFRDGTLVIFTKGPYAGKAARLIIGTSYHLTRFRLRKDYYYPFQNRRGNPDPTSVEFKVCKLPPERKYDRLEEYYSRHLDGSRLDGIW